MKFLFLFFLICLQHALRIYHKDQHTIMYSTVAHICAALLHLVFNGKAERWITKELQVKLNQTCNTCDIVQRVPRTKMRLRNLSPYIYWELVLCLPISMSALFYRKCQSTVFAQMYRKAGKLWDMKSSLLYRQEDSASVGGSFLLI